MRVCRKDTIDFKGRLGKIYGRGVHGVQVLDFEGLIDLMAEGLSHRMLMEHRDAEGHTRLRVPDRSPTRDLSAYWRGISSEGDFFSTALSYTAIRDPMLRLCHRFIVCSIAGRSQAPEKGLTVIVRDLPVIDMAELVRLLICDELDDTWAWVALGRERLGEEVHGLRGNMAEQRDVLDSMACDFFRFTTWKVTSLSLMMDRSEIR
ncbi:hypothetical protein Tco_0077715 [Tanacetum coccineum]